MSINKMEKLKELEKRVEALEKKLEDPSWLKAQSAKILGGVKSKKKAAASRENGKAGGRPRKKI